MARTKREPPRGIIQTGAPAGSITHARYEVDAPLDGMLEHWWTVRWALPEGAEETRATLPHPSIHVTFEEATGAQVVGVVRGRFTWRTRGAGRIFAAKFRPGAFRPLAGRPLHTLTDRRLPLGELLPAADVRALERGLRERESDAERVAFSTQFWGARMPPPDPRAPLLATLVEAATHDRHLTRVEELRARSGMGMRALQRWFRDAVGISPKWMVQRYRLHDALQGLERGEQNLAALAATLGYADQAHFSRDFRALVGEPPSAYLARLG